MLESAGTGGKHAGDGSGQWPARGQTWNRREDLNEQLEKQGWISRLDLSGRLKGRVCGRRVDSNGRLEGQVCGRRVDSNGRLEGRVCGRRVDSNGRRKWQAWAETLGGARAVWKASEFMSGR